MDSQSARKHLSLDQALRAQSALRKAAGLGPEVFPVQAFVGMISDDIETLRQQGRTDADIALLISTHSEIPISGEEIATNYVPPEQRHPEQF